MTLIFSDKTHVTPKSQIKYQCWLEIMTLDAKMSMTEYKTQYFRHF